MYKTPGPTGRSTTPSMSNTLVKVDRHCVNAERWIQAEAAADWEHA